MTTRATVVVAGLLAVLGSAVFVSDLSRVVRRVRHNDEVHYIVHLLAGRTLSLYPWTAAMADTQYARGMYHAHTPREKALLTTARPSTLRERFDEAPVVLSTVVRRLAS